jgi:dethiobiotin synthetase
MKIFVTGISTDVGKTIASAIITEALQADYWKPVQAGDIENTDSHKIGRLISNGKSVLHPESYLLLTPASPHYAAEIDGVKIDIAKITEPETQNHLVIEGAGGIFVPLNDTETILNLIRPEYKVVVVSRNYLGSINHTLLTIEALKSKNITSAIIFSGEKNESSEQLILNKTGLKCIGRIEQEPYFDKNVIAEYADLFRENLLQL